MNTKRYAVIDSVGNILIRGAEFEMAIAFIRGFMLSFYNEVLDIRIVEDPAFAPVQDASESDDNKTSEEISMTINEPSVSDDSESKSTSTKTKKKVDGGKSE